MEGECDGYSATVTHSASFLAAGCKSNLLERAHSREKPETMSAALLMPRVWRQSRQTAPRALLLQRRALASAPAKTTTKVSYLIIDGYIQTGREGLVAGGATTAGELYAQMFAKCTPAHLEVEYDLVFPSDPGFQPPDLSKVRAVPVVTSTG